MQPRRTHRNQKLALWLFGLPLLMLGVSFAAVPLYDLFCRVTGYGGTTQRAEALPASRSGVHTRTVTVNFNTDVHPDLPWEFRPGQREMTAKIGEMYQTSFFAKNISKTPVVGTATFNVQPDVVGALFNKIQCFCFEKQLLLPGEEKEFPVQFFVDEAMLDDVQYKDTRNITLSYTFFRDKDQSQATVARTAAFTSPVSSNPVP
jgi:cytochrome c oxidase assembly protein subunit 11